MIFDHAGNIYGTTAGQGEFGWGSVFQLTPAGGGWAESTVYSFTGGSDGSTPQGGVIIDTNGDLYGNAGVVFQLVQSGLGWAENVLYTFHQDSGGFGDFGGLIFDQSGNLYGATAYGGQQLGGTIYSLARSGNNWMFNVLYSLSGPNGGSTGSLFMDTTGAIYGTTVHDGSFQQGNVFKLTRSGGSWTYVDIYDFTGGTDGGAPLSGVIVDASGNIYGTTNVGGSYGYGVIYELSPQNDHEMSQIVQTKE